MLPCRTQYKTMLLVYKTGPDRSFLSVPHPLTRGLCKNPPGLCVEMTNIVQKGQQRWMPNVFTKKRTANTSHISLSVLNGTIRQQCLLRLEVALQKKLLSPCVPSVVVVFLSQAFSLTCAAAAVVTLTPSSSSLPLLCLHSLASVSSS